MISLAIQWRSSRSETRSLLSVRSIAIYRRSKEAFLFLAKRMELVVEDC